MKLLEIHEWLISLLAFITCIGLTIKAVKYRSFYFIGDMIPRLYISIIYGYFWIYFPSDPVSFLGMLIRYGLTTLFVTEIVRQLFDMSASIKNKRTKNENYGTIIK